MINRRKRHRGIPIPSDSPLHMVREHSKHFDFKSEEIIMLEGSDRTPLQTPEGGKILGASRSEPGLTVTSADGEAIVGGPNRKNIASTKNDPKWAPSNLRMGPNCAQIGFK